MAGTVALLVTLLRLWVGRDRTVFAIAFDEAAHLAIARTLTGDADWSTKGITYSPGFGTLLAPIHWFTADPTTSYRAALVVMAVLGGVAALLLVWIGIRITAVPVMWVGVASLGASIVPGVLLQNLWATPESLIAVLFLATLLATLALVDRPSPTRGFLAIALAVGAFCAHGRMAPLVASVCVVILALAVLRRLSAVVAVILVGLAVLLVALAQAYSTWVLKIVWVSADGEANYSAVLSSLSEPGRALVTALGMTWYQLVTTAGLMAVGAWALGASLVRMSTFRPIGLRLADTLVIVVLTVPALGLAALFMTRGELAEQMVYGRYWDAILGPVLLLGLCVLGASSPRALRTAAIVALASTAGAGAVLAAVRQQEIDRAIETLGFAGSRRILSLYGYLGDVETIQIWPITVVALMVSAGIFAVAFVRLAGPAVGRVLLAVLLLVLGYVANARVIDAPGLAALNAHESRSTLTAAALDGSVAPGDVIAFRWDPAAAPQRQLFRLWMAYQFYLPQNPIALDASADRVEALGRYVFAAKDDPALVGSGSRLLWEDSRGPLGLWAVSSSRSEPAQPG